MSADSEIGFQEFQSLAAAEQERIAGSIFAGPDHPIFDGIRTAFLKAYPQSEGARVFVGGADAHGWVPAITVTPDPGTRLVSLPESFMGLPVIRSYKRPKR